MNDARPTGSNTVNATEFGARPFKACIVIPVYNHGPQLRPILGTLATFGLPLILVNDGSNAETSAILERAAEQAGVHLVRRTRNGGKGAAMIAGFHAAHDAGYSHVLQVDADGQHDLDDIPRFLAASRAHPAKMVTGRAVYDQSVPKVRSYGRRLTHLCVWIECLSTDIKDTMCGFRVYPLKPALEVINSRFIGKRMDFDMDIAVRLFWKGVLPENIDTKVRYHHDGVSHFRMFRDNACISWMHTRLMVGMLFRAPGLLMRHARPLREDHWSENRERGSFFGLRFMLLLYRSGGRWIASALIYPIVLYFFLTGRKARRNSMLYLKQLHTFCPTAIGHPPTWRDSLKHFMSFGKSIMERLDAWMDNIDPDRLNWDNQQDLADRLDAKQGSVLIGAHLGVLELLRGLIFRKGVRSINALVFHRHAPGFNKILHMANPRTTSNLISVEPFTPSVAIHLQTLIENGEFIAILGDRSSVGARHRVQNVSFLGRPAPFPEGPFLLASVLKCPVFLLFCLRGEKSTYDVVFEVFEEKQLTLLRRERKQALNAAMARYAKALEQQCCKAPYQWYNFHNIWEHHAE